MAIPAFVNPAFANYRKARCYNFDRPIAMTKSVCAHNRTQFIAKDKDAQYMECLDCGEILEAGEMEAAEKKESAGFDESLSDA